MKHILTILIFTAAIAGPLCAGPIEDENLYVVPRAGRVLPDDLADLLRRAGQRPDAETRLETLEAIRKYQIAAVADTVRDLLGDQRDIVRSSAIRAAVTLELTDTAPAIADIVRRTPSKSPAQRDLITTGDAALASFKSAVMTEDWLTRIADREALIVLRASAARSLGIVHQPAMPDPVAAALIQLTTDATEPPMLRLAAAQAVAAQPSAQDPAVTMMAGSMLDRLIGIAMAAPKPNAQVLAALHANAQFEEPAVQAPALRRLIDLGPAAAPFELLKAVVGSADPIVRRLAVEGARLHPEPASVNLVFAQLNDPHPDVRAMGTQTLIELAKVASLDALIRSRLTTTVANLVKFDDAGKLRRWGEAEQLARLAAALDHKPVAMDLTRFYRYPRQETAVAAIQTVRVLDVPETHPPTVELLKEIIAFSLQVEGGINSLKEDKAAVGLFLTKVGQQYQLAEEAALTLGVWAEPTADEPLRSIIPKMHPISARVRAAGIWALGHIHAGQDPKPLAAKLVERMNDNKSLIPEADNVREQCAVALGRMLSQSQLGALRKKYADVEDITELRYAARWSVGQITGQLPPALTFEPTTIRETFIAPLYRR